MPSSPVNVKRRVEPTPNMASISAATESVNVNENQTVFGQIYQKRKDVMKYTSSAMNEKNMFRICPSLYANFGNVSDFNPHSGVELRS